MSKSTLDTVSGGARPDEVVHSQQGARTASQVAAELDMLATSGWRAWHDRVVPGTGETIDHLLLGPPGLVLVCSIESASTGFEGVEIQQTRARVEDQRARAQFAVNQSVGPLAERFADWSVPLWAAVVVAGQAVETHDSPQVIRLRHAVDFFRAVKARLLPMQVTQLEPHVDELFPHLSAVS